MANIASIKLAWYMHVVTGISQPFPAEKSGAAYCRWANIFLIKEWYAEEFPFRVQAPSEIHDFCLMPVNLWIMPYSAYTYPVTSG